MKGDGTDRARARPGHNSVERRARVRLRNPVVTDVVGIRSRFDTVSSPDANSLVDDDTKPGVGGDHGFGFSSGVVSGAPQVGVFCTLMMMPWVFFIFGLTSIRTAIPGWTVNGCSQKT